MVFNSYIFFLIVLPLFLVGFYVLRNRTYQGCKWWIIAVSLLFYAPFGLKNCAVLAVSIVMNALLARSIGKAAAKRTLLLLGLLINVGTLLFFKFSGVFFPVAISFYTFNQISYLVDTYRGEIKEFVATDYLCYILFFPKLLQGPLMGYGEFTGQLKASVAGGMINGDNKDSFSAGAPGFEVILRGLYLFSMGLFKKVIMADTFGKAVDYGFGNIPGLGSLEAVLVAVFYSFQLYFDFSGYCDMAEAICMMMGFELPLNFDSPYKATDIMDFWKRWHITLTRFFTKYVYIPLGGNRKGAARMYLNFMIVFLLSGLWHGSGWTFIIWGAMHGVLYVLTRFVKEMTGNGKAVPGRKIDDHGKEKGDNAIGSEFLSGVGRGIKILLTFIYVTLAWVFFRAANASDAIGLITRMFTGGRKPIATQLSSCFQLDELWYFIKVTPIMRLSFAWDTCLWLFLIVSCGMIFFVPNAITISKKCRVNIGTTLLTAFLLLWSILSFAGNNIQDNI